MATTIAPALDASAHWNAIKALLTPTVGANVFDYGKVPGADGNSGVLPATYVLLTVERRYVEPQTAGRSGVTGWRVSCRFVGNTTPNARAAGNWVTAALNEVRIALGSVSSTPITHESTTAVESDDGMYSGLSQWTYAITL